MSDKPKPCPPQHPNLGPLQEAAAEGGSLLHRLDPRAKLICAFAGTLVLATSPGPTAPALGLAGGVFLAAWARLGWGRVLSRAAGINVFVVFLWVFLPWKVEYNGGLDLVYNPGGLEMAGLITLKVNALFLLLMSLLGTSRVNDLLHTLAHFHLPEKLVTLFLLFHRYLYLMFREYQRLVGAMKVRGFQPGTNLHTYRAYAYLVGMLLGQKL
jgi:ABC-type cobalt transport system, permease component CbiQ and related transporters